MKPPNSPELEPIRAQGDQTAQKGSEAWRAVGGGRSLALLSASLPPELPLDLGVPSPVPNPCQLVTKKGAIFCPIPLRSVTSNKLVLYDMFCLARHPFLKFQ